MAVDREPWRTAQAGKAASGPFKGGAFPAGASVPCSSGIVPMPQPDRECQGTGRERKEGRGCLVYWMHQSLDPQV